MFTASLRANLVACGCRSGVVRVVDGPQPRQPDVVHNLVPRSYAGQVKAAVALDAFDVAVIQHEFGTYGGIYGGIDGDDVLGVLDWLTVPAIAVLHSVPPAPSRRQRGILERVAGRADAVITLTEIARTRLLGVYRVDPAKVVVIPHGAVDSIAVAAVQNRLRPPTLLTWGLLGPGKGVEAVIDVLSMLRELDPRLRYRVVGRTHPGMSEPDADAYRGALLARAAARGVADMVSFEDGFLDLPSLHRVVAQADVVVLAYESRDQVSSGVLTEAVAAGKPVVATAFPHAVELLGAGAGLVVAHDDLAALADGLRRVLVEPGLASSMSVQAHLAAPALRWFPVAARYRALATSLVSTNVSADVSTKAEV